LLYYLIHYVFFHRYLVLMSLFHYRKNDPQFSARQKTNELLVVIESYKYCDKVANLLSYMSKIDECECEDRLVTFMFEFPYKRVVSWGIRASWPSVRFKWCGRLDCCDNRLDASFMQEDSSDEENGGHLCDN
jgi:hypothetical protein